VNRMRTYLPRLGVFLAISLTLVSAIRAAQSSPPPSAPQAGSSRLASVAVTGSKKFTSDQIAATTGLHTGAMVTRDDLQKGADRLSQLGLFATVQYKFATTGAGVALEYQVTDAASVHVMFDNFPWFSDDEMAQALKISGVLFDGTAPEHGAILDDMSAAIEKLLNSKGINGSVSHALVPDPSPQLYGDKLVQQFHVDGADLTIAAVNFSDELARQDRGIQSSLANLVGSPYTRGAIELFEFEQVRPAYLSRGFLKVQFAAPVVHMEAGAAGSSPSRVVVAAAIDPGPTFNWGSITWKGNTAIPSSQLDAAIPLRAGDLADLMKLEGAWDRVRAMYLRLGYLDVSLTTVSQFDDAAKRVALTTTITEGPQYRMGNLVITGLSIEGERRIRDAWKIPLGSLFDAAAFDQFLDTGIKEAFTGLPVHYDKIGRFLQKDSKAGTVDVMLDFQ
jgi:outer membrane protein assembly factor BamA